MSADLKKAIEKAQEILKANSVISPPVIVEDVARNYGFRLSEVDFNGQGDVAGFIDPENKIIYVNRCDSDSRKAFTIAHELGHWFLHQEKLHSAPEEYAVLYRKPIGGEADNIEKEANCFAAHLLVPGELLNEYKDESVNTISKIFGVSVELVGYRKIQEGIC